MPIPKIDEYSFGHIKIDDRTYTSDVIIHPDGVQAEWWRIQGHSLDLRDLDSIWAWEPVVLVIGTGMSGVMQVPEETGRLIRQREVELVVEPTEQACQTYNRHSAVRRTVAALHLTC
jgi:hypothetical protein